jgi:hypothetical protein
VTLSITQKLIAIHHLQALLNHRANACASCALKLFTAGAHFKAKYTKQA